MLEKIHSHYYGNSGERVIDDQDRVWEYYSLIHSIGFCDICGEEISHGWLNLCGIGEVICSDHMHITKV